MLNSVGMNGIVEGKKAGSITYNGKEQKVKTVLDRNPLKCTLVPEYKDVVVIDGKQYDVQRGQSLGHVPSSDYVVIEGKKYNVHDPLVGTLTTSLKNIMKQPQGLNVDA